ncbi:MAG: hypothetical protein H0U13_00530 [Gemmatimonadaceae bacterium]|nr:hypothetical protein [Gemmatimonadaceae bacterium]
MTEQRLFHDHNIALPAIADAKASAPTDLDEPLANPTTLSFIQSLSGCVRISQRVETMAEPSAS